MSGDKGINLAPVLPGWILNNQPKQKTTGSHSPRLLDEDYEFGWSFGLSGSEVYEAKTTEGA